MSSIASLFDGVFLNLTLGVVPPSNLVPDIRRETLLDLAAIALAGQGNAGLARVMAMAAVWQTCAPRGGGCFTMSAMNCALPSREG